MTAIRHLFAQRHLAMLLCAAALLLKLIVPTGYMVGPVDGRAAIILCPGGGAMPASLHGGMAPADRGMSHQAGADRPAGHSDGSHGRDMPCAFAGLAAPGLAAVDPVQPMRPIAIVPATGGAAITLPRLPAVSHLRPPLRGPPARS